MDELKSIIKHKYNLDIVSVKALQRGSSHLQEAFIAQDSRGEKFFIKTFDKTTDIVKRSVKLNFQLGNLGFPAIKVRYATIPINRSLSLKYFYMALVSR